MIRYAALLYIMSKIENESSFLSAKGVSREKLGFASLPRNCRTRQCARFAPPNHSSLRSWSELDVRRLICRCRRHSFKYKFLSASSFIHFRGVDIALRVSCKIMQNTERAGRLDLATTRLPALPRAARSTERADHLERFTIKGYDLLLAPIPNE